MTPVGMSGSVGGDNGKSGAPRMSSPTEQEYWPELLERLTEEPVSTLAEHYGLEAADIDAALARTSGDRPVQQEAWWPEVLRGHEQGSLRQLARRFGTNPRRLRRGLARCAVRVGGETISEGGIADLAVFRDRLGQEPDRSLATEAGVTVEAIKGERRRLGIEPYRMKPDVEEWGSKPPSKREKPKPRRRWQDAPEPVIIRRAGHGRDGEPEIEDAPASPEIVAAPVVERKARPQLAGFRSVGLGAEPSAAVAPFETGSDPRKRRRLVRPVASDEEEQSKPSGVPQGFGRLPRLGGPPPVRMIEPDQAAIEALDPTPPPLVRARKMARKPEETPRALPPVPEPTPTPRAKPAAKPKVKAAVKPAAEPKVKAAVKPAAEPKVKAAVKPAAEPKVKAAVKPKAKSAAKPKVKAAVKPEPAEIRPPLPLEPAPAVSPQPAPPVAPPVDEPTSERGAFAWQVQLPGKTEPMLVLADDMQSALALASSHLGGEPLEGAKAWRLAEVLHEDREG